MAGLGISTNRGTSENYVAPVSSAQPSASMGIPSNSLMGRVTESKLQSLEKAQADARKAEQENNKPQLLSLASHVSTRWDAALRSKQNSKIENRLLNAVRQRTGVYDPQKAAEIQAFGGSQIYMMLTNVKARAAEAWVRDVLLPPGDKPWSLDPTPIPTLPEGKEIEIADQVKQEATIMFMGMLDTGTPMSDLPEDKIDDRFQEIKDKVQKEKVKFAKETTNRMEIKIEDDLVQGNYYIALSQFITDLMTYPTAFMKGPVVRTRKSLVWTQDQTGNYVPAVDLKPRREYYKVSPMDMYPSPGCRGVQDGYMCERLRLRRSDIESMKGSPGYSTDSINGALLQYGKGGLKQWLAIDQERADVENRPNEFDDPDPVIDCIEYWGTALGSTLLEWGMAAKEVPDPTANYQISAMLIGGWVIMARINAHPLGLRPYYSASFDSINDSIWGRCPADLMSDIQDICNAAARNLVNNLAISSGPQVEVYTNRLAPGENIEDIYPWKIWKTLDAEMGTNNPAVNFWQPDSNADALLKVYEYFFKQASEQTGIPAFTYGSDTKGGAGSTASGLSMLMNAASKTMKGVIAHIDERVIKPSIKEHWTHVMLYDNEINKIGDINVVARASEHLIIAEQMQLRRTEALQATNNPWDERIIGDKGRATMLRELMQSLKMDSEEIIPTKEDMEANEMAMSDSMMVPPGGIPPEAGGMPGGMPGAAIIDAAGNQAGQSPGATMPAQQGISARRN